MNVYDFTVKDNKDNDVSLSEYKGKVLLIVNTQWNFAKFLIDRSCNMAERFAPSEKPDSLENSIKTQLSR